MTNGFVDTSYGRIPGCPICGVIPLSKTHVCEHGVTPAPSSDISISVTIQDEATYRALVDPDDPELYE